MFDYFKQIPIGAYDVRAAYEKNRVICHPDDYKDMAECGVVEALTEGGIEVVPTELAEKGKQIVTGELACAVFEKWRIEK